MIFTGWGHCTEFPQYSHTVGWVTERTSNMQNNPCHLFSNILFQNNWRKKTRGGTG